MPAPIRIEDYFVEHLNYDVNPNLLGEEIPESSVENHIGIRAEYALAPHDEGEEAASASERMIVRLTVTVNGDDAESPDQPMHRIDLRVAGVFARDRHEEIERPMSPEEYLTHSLASCISTLYGVAREVLASLTSPSPFPKLMLPSIVPYALASRIVKDQTDSEASA